MAKKNQTKITNYSLCVGEVTEDKGKFLILSPTSENLKKSNSYYPEFPEELALNKVVPLETLFFYKIEQYDSTPFPSRELLFYEEGIGELKKDGNETVLQVITPLFYYTKENGRKPCIRRTAEFDKNGKSLLITSRLPQNITDLFQFKDTVLCSDGDGRPNLVTLEENSLLANTKQGISSQTVQNLLLDNYEPLITQCDRFELTGKNSIIISNSLQLKASRSRPANPQPGTIVYNSRKKAFQGYDGKSWKTLKWED